MFYLTRSTKNKKAINLWSFFCHEFHEFTQIISIKIKYNKLVKISAIRGKPIFVYLCVTFVCLCEIISKTSKFHKAEYN